MTGLQGRLLDRLPAGLAARPDEWLIALLCVTSGLGALLGAVNVNSVESLLPLVVYRAWGAVLLAGALGLLCGLTSIKNLEPGGRLVVARAPCYRFGQRMLFIGGLTYAACLFMVVGTAAAVTGGVILAFSAARGIRLLTLRREATRGHH